MTMGNNNNNIIIMIIIIRNKYQITSHQKLNLKANFCMLSVLCSPIWTYLYN